MKEDKKKKKRVADASEKIDKKKGKKNEPEVVKEIKERIKLDERFLRQGNEFIPTGINIDTKTTTLDDIASSGDVSLELEEIVASAPAPETNVKFNDTSDDIKYATGGEESVVKYDASTSYAEIESDINVPKMSSAKQFEEQAVMRQESAQFDIEQRQKDFMGSGLTYEPTQKRRCDVQFGDVDDLSKPKSAIDKIKDSYIN